MKNLIIVVILVITSLMACTTTQDFEKNDSELVVKNQSPTASPTASPTPNPSFTIDSIDSISLQKLLVKYGIPATVEKEKIIEKEVVVERPVFYPISQLSMVKSGNTAGVETPASYNGQVKWYEYNEAYPVEVYCQPFRQTDVYLEPGEILMDQPKISDPDAWTLDSVLSLDNGLKVQHLLIKPKGYGKDYVASMNIYTDRRIYHITLRAFIDTYMLAVRFRYGNQFKTDSNPRPFQAVRSPKTTLSLNTDDIISSMKPIDEAGNSGLLKNNNGSISEVPTYADSFDYEMTSPNIYIPWKPIRVYDNGKFTYINFGPDLTYHDMPNVFMNTNEVVNFFPLNEKRTIIIPRLITKLTLKAGNIWITIKKKGA